MNSLTRTNGQLPWLIENVFGRNVNDFSTDNTAALQSVPAVNVLEYIDGFRIGVAAPGLKKSDFRLNLNHNKLTVSSTRENTQSDQEGETFTRREFSYTSFKRTFTLPTSVDSGAIQANYTDGVLKIDIHKREEARVKPPRQIAIG